MALQYWMIPRPHRKLIRVPKSIAAFASVALGEPWQGNRPLQMQFETELERNGLKRRGEHSERDRGRGGSGGRTHASMLQALGLYFTYKETPESEEEVHLTLAGQALVGQEDALPILRRQVMAHQFPSAYSIGLPNPVADRFRLRPFTLLLRLLRDEDLSGYLTDAEIAACIITYGETHTVAGANSVKKRILAFRQEGTASLEPDFAQRFGLPEDHSALKDHIYKSSGKLGAIANTAAQWLRYTGYAVEAQGSNFGASEKTVTAINENLLDEIDAAIETWGTSSVDSLSHLRKMADRFKRERKPEDHFEWHRAAAAFQRTYGRTPTSRKDQRVIGDLRQYSEKSRITGMVSASLVHLYATEPIGAITDDIINAVVNHCGLSRDVVSDTLHNLIRSPQQGLSQFLDRYQQMAFSGTDEAIAFEKATANVIKSVFGLEAHQIGQGGRVPDVEIRTKEWTGIIDTKAYATYDLPSDHQLRMESSYVPKYKGNAPDLAFFMYIAGGFAASINGKLSRVIENTGVKGSGIGIVAWLELIKGYKNSSMKSSDLLKLWSIGREITPKDVADALAEQPG